MVTFSWLTPMILNAQIGIWEMVNKIQIEAITTFPINSGVHMNILLILNGKSFSIYVHIGLLIHID